MRKSRNSICNVVNVRDFTRFQDFSKSLMPFHGAWYKNACTVLVTVDQFLKMSINSSNSLIE